MKELCLDHFLEAARAEGEADSEGHFTISHAQAMQKMARYSLPYPEAWILKVVQAAVSWRVPEIVIRQTRLHTTIDFCPAEKKDIPTEKVVVATLMGQVGTGTIPVSKLCLALRTLVRVEDYSFILTLDTGRSETLPLYAGHDAQSLTRFARLRMARKGSPGIRLVVLHLRRGEHLVGRVLYRFSPWFRRDRRIADELRRTATVCPLPLHLNGRLENRLLDSSLYGFSHTRRPVVLGGVKVPGESLLSLGVESRLWRVPYLVSPNGFEKDDAAENRFTGWFLLRGREVRGRTSPPVRVEHHEIQWICDGTVVQRETFPFSTFLLKLTVFLNADGLQTDITGILLKDSEEKKARWLAHLRLLAEELDNFALQSEHFFDPGDAKTARLSPAERKRWSKLLRHDLTGLSALSDPELVKVEHTSRRSRFDIHDVGHSFLRSGKYTSEVVRSRDGSSHLLISVDRPQDN